MSDKEWIVLEKGRQRIRRRRRSTKLQFQKELGVHDKDDVSPEKLSLNLIFTLDVGIGISAVDESSVEIGYISFQRFRFAYNRTATLESCGVVIGELQLDSYLQDTPFPVVIRGDRHSSSENKTENFEKKPMLFVQVSRKCEESLDVFENIDIQIRRTLHFHIDEAFVLALFAFLNSVNVEEETRQNKYDENRDNSVLALKQLNKLNEDIDTSSNLNRVGERERLYIKKLRISPVRFVVSFIAAIGTWCSSAKRENTTRVGLWRSLPPVCSRISITCRSMA